MGERLTPSLHSVEKPRPKREIRKLPDLGHIKPDSLALEQLAETFSSIHIRSFRNARGKTQWEVISFITPKNERPREIRKTKDGAIRRAFDRAKEGHTQILVKDEGGNVIEKIQLEKNKKSKKKGVRAKH